MDAPHESYDQLLKRKKIWDDNEVDKSAGGSGWGFFQMSKEERYWVGVAWRTMAAVDEVHEVLQKLFMRGITDRMSWKWQAAQGKNTLAI